MNQKPKVKPDALCKTRLTHNIIWKKWQHCKSIYQQQRIQSNSRAELSRRKMQSIQRGDISNSLEYNEHYQSSVQNIGKSKSKSKNMNRASYQEFVKKVGDNVVVLGPQWIKIGQLNSYCISYPKSKISKAINTQPNPQQLIRNIRKSLKARSCRSWNRMKTEPVPQRTHHPSLSEQIRTYQIASQQWNKKSKTVSTQKLNTNTNKEINNSNINSHYKSRHMKSVSKSSCRPWSKFEKDSEKDKDIM